ncbi:DUF4809 family protein [Carnobacterium divergens]|uniref:DUF4809 family protein n=1 Tax=Carnobacterium divergens TaxID=2748 RepID=UPI0039AFAE8D
MKEIVLSSSVDLTEGGCNACGIVKSVCYTLLVNGREIALDGLSVHTVVMTIVLTEGWKQSFEVQMMDEFTLFTKGAHQVKLIEAYDQFIYEGHKTIECSNKINEVNQLFNQVEEILRELFEVDNYVFKLSDAMASK